MPPVVQKFKGFQLNNDFESQIHLATFIILVLELPRRLERYLGLA
jgi:hypothetical protein